MSKTKTDTATTTENLPVLFDQGKVREIEMVARECGFAALAKLGQFERADRLLTGIGILKSLISDDMIKKLRNLENSALGYKTDRDPARQKDAKAPYPDVVVKDCFISSLLHGLYPVNNEWNIIAGQMYVTLNGFRRLVNEFPGVSDVVLTPGVYQPSNDKTCCFVPVVCSWRLHGELHELHLIHDGKRDDRIIVKSDAFLGPDGIFGKAKRKAYARIFEVLTSQTVQDGDVDDLRRTAPTKQLAAPTQQRTLDDVATDIDEEDAQQTLREANA